MASDDSSVRVAVRIRPQLPREIIDMCRVCTNVTPGEPQVTLGSDKAFTYDYIFDTNSSQLDVYDVCSKRLVQGTLEGYNATVLAYGQTGSGKTYTMGTGFDIDISQEQVGIIPRAIHELFNGINELTQKSIANNEPPPQFKVTAQFLELYNEEILDLFDASSGYLVGKGRQSNIKIHEDINHCIYVTGVKSERINSAEEALQWLRQGALSRTTASTNMNEQSSRSHAIFSLHVRQQRLVKMDGDAMDDGENKENNQEFETLTAKFHFVDLAGSERLKRTGASGERAKEGISINCGLLALGNVISALGDPMKKALHVPYRDSKLTRLLQDSLGGNSRTLMIACVSPSDQDFMETLNTLKYANRARNIQNKVFINQDKSSRTIALLKKEIQQLQLELLEYKQGKRFMNEDGTETVNDMFHENTLLQTELDNLRTRVKGMQETIDSLSAKNAELLAEQVCSQWINTETGGNNEVSEIIKGYIVEIEGLRAKLLETESVCTQLRKTVSRNRTSLMSPIRTESTSDPNIDSIIELARKDLEKDVTILARNVSKMNNVNRSDSESDSESDSQSTEENEEVNAYSEELAQLNSEISMKQRLIDELEKTQKKLTNMKFQYEEKMIQLHKKIVTTEQERDKVLASFAEKKDSSEKVKKVTEDYEKKLISLQQQLKSVQAANKEHTRQLRHQSKFETQIKTLNSEVSEMKRTKVKLMNKMREDANKHKESELRRNREIAQLKKKSRQDANLIRNLEMEKHTKEVVLKRKQEELTALRKATKAKTRFNNKIKGSPKIAKNKWISVEKNIAACTMNKQSLVTLEREMQKNIERRASLQEEIKLKFNQMAEESFSNSLVIQEEIDSLKTNLEHVQNTIQDLQHEILQVEETKTSTDNGDILDGIFDLRDASYIIDKLYNMTLHQSYLVAQKNADNFELRAQFEQLKRESETQEQLLKHLLERGSNPILDNRSPFNSGLNSCKSSRSPSPTYESRSISSDTGRTKGRKLTFCPAELLSLETYSINNSCGTKSALGSPEIIQPTPPLLQRSLTSIRIHSVPSSPALQRKGLAVSPKMTRKNTYTLLSNHPSMERGLDKSPPNSPPVYRRQTSREENVFSRLTSQPTQQSNNRNPGKISTCNIRKGQKSPLICTNVVEGHSRAVLALHATDDLLFTASKDRTVVSWDLSELKEIRSFGNHPNNVVAVKYDAAHKRLFTVSSSFVKIWDIRTSKCIKTLTSSGLSATVTHQIGSGVEPQINDIALNHRGVALYTAAGDKVRQWDLRKYSVVGKLLSGHQAAIMCLALSSTSSIEDLIVTGSKDHYIKIFDVPINGGGVINPRVKLEPPHYDGIQCVAIRGKTLVSGSRDCIIKEWSLESHELVISATNAHKDWVTGLTFVPQTPLLLSCCRDGTVKLWSTVSFLQIGEMKAHTSPINAITTNSTHVFTASSEGDVKMWKHPTMKNQDDIMTMSTGHMFQLSV